MHIHTHTHTHQREMKEIRSVIIITNYLRINSLKPKWGFLRKRFYCVLSGEREGGKQVHRGRNLTST